MTPSCTSLIRIRLFKPFESLVSSLCSPHAKSHFFSTIGAATTIGAVLSFVLSRTQPEKETEPGAEIWRPKDAADVFWYWGCSEADIDKIFFRCPSLRKANLPKLESKVRLLRGLGLKSSDMVSIVHRCPRFLSYRISRYFDERLDYLESFLGSKELLIKAIIRNPTLLTYDFQKTVKPVVNMYAEMGVSKTDFISMLLSRATVISRSRMCEEKLYYISRTGVPKESKMYKHVVAIIAVSRLETIREKLAHFQKFGYSEDEILEAVGRSPLLLSLSTDKVQRNMTFLVGTLKLPAKVALDHPFLLFQNMETTLKPRMHLACKIEDMGLLPQIKGPTMLTALRMAEKRFLKAFVTCHPQDLSDELLEYYRHAKGVKRLAESSRKNFNKGFHF